ncbi:MAG: Pyridoxamine 5'-phosphate oxidase [Methanosaeta sp. PtaU1.Bin112]|nr:MAG: Pyridoxamine 5'-phosphate oxidase [Methanosaeta sp. PtaU1.Bin112]
MDYNDCLKFANDNPVSFIATMDGEMPRVRAFLMWFADESGFYYHTATSKSVCKQLMNNPNIEVCFYHAGDIMAKNMMRVSGRVEFLDDAGLRARLLEERPFLRAIVNGPKDPLLTIFRIHEGEVQFWSMADNLREADTPRIKFG